MIEDEQSVIYKVENMAASATDISNNNPTNGSADEGDYSENPNETFSQQQRVYSDSKNDHAIISASQMATIK